MGGDTGVDTGVDTGATADGAAEGVTARLAAFVAQADAGAIPEAVLHEGRRCLVNLFGVALHATQDPALPMLLDVLEARIRGIDRVAMQNLIDCEQAWMLGKTAVPNRTGGGFHRADKELKHETVWLHNLMIRHASSHASLPVRHQGPSVAPPSGPLALGLRYDKGPRGTFESPLWPDSQAAKDALGLERLKRVESEASLARQRARASRPATAGVKPKKNTKKPHTWC
jgi:hypothetical protein